MSGRDVRGWEVDIIIRACHLGRKPRRGGRLARERNIIIRVDFKEGVSEGREEILDEDMFEIQKDDIIITEDKM